MPKKPTTVTDILRLASDPKVREKIKEFVTSKRYSGKKYTFEEAYKDARSNGQKTFLWDGRYYNTDYEGAHGKQYKEDVASGKAAAWEKEYPNFTNPELRKEKQEELGTYGITNEQTKNKTIKDRTLRKIPARGYDVNDAISAIRGEHHSFSRYDSVDDLISALRKKYPKLKDTPLTGGYVDTFDGGKAIYLDSARELKKPDKVDDDMWQAFINDVANYDRFNAMGGNPAEIHRPELDYLLGYPTSVNALVKDIEGGLSNTPTISRYRTGSLPYYYTTPLIEASVPFVPEKFLSIGRERREKEKEIEGLESRLVHPNVESLPEGSSYADYVAADEKDMSLPGNKDIYKVINDYYDAKLGLFDEFTERMYDKNNPEYAERWNNLGVGMYYGGLDIDYQQLARSSATPADIDTLGRIGAFDYLEPLELLPGNHLAGTGDEAYYRADDDYDFYKGKYSKLIDRINPSKEDHNKYNGSGINTAGYIYSDPSLGSYTLGVPKDTSFVSVWDKFDVDPFGSGNDKPIIQVGKPFEYYTRFYPEGKTPDIDKLYKEFNSYSGGGDKKDRKRIDSVTNMILQEAEARDRYESGKIDDPFIQPLTYDIMQYMPVVGDALQAVEAANDAKNKRWGRAALGAGLLLVPNLVEKPIKEAAKYVIKKFPGYQLKMLLSGNPLEKQISKAGTVNVNNVKALANKGSNVERAVIDKVLDSEQFAGLKNIDYNDFRKAVQDELITYNRKPDLRYRDYGLDRLGVSDMRMSEEEEFMEVLDNAHDYLMRHPELNMDVDRYGDIYSTVESEITPWGEELAEPIGSIESVLDANYPDWRKEYKKLPNTERETFTFSSPRIPQGSGKHYDASTLGHSRTYTTADEPDILHVMESQSDWAQSGKIPKESRKYFMNGQDVTGDIERELSSRKDLSASAYSGGTPAEKHLLYNSKYFTFGRNVEEMKRFDELASEYNLAWSDYTRAIARDAKSSDTLNAKNKVEKLRSELFMFTKGDPRPYYGQNREPVLRPEIESRVTPNLQELHLAENYPIRQLQENLRFAAERGQTKMRYPTRETAAKIEGYPEKTIYVDEFGRETPNYFEYSDELLSKVEKKKQELANEIDRLDKESNGSIGWVSRYGGRPIWVTPEEESALIWLEKDIDFMLKPERNIKPGITKKIVYDYEDILKRYSDFPKQYQKLFKGSEVRNVVDPKGNTWYEVDVPKDYLNMEWPYAQGGLLANPFGGGGPTKLLGGINPALVAAKAAKSKYLQDYVNRGQVWDYPDNIKELIHDYLLSPYNGSADEISSDDPETLTNWRRAILAKYLGLNAASIRFKPEDYIKESEYRPSISNNDDAKYYTYDISKKRLKEAFSNLNGKYKIDFGDDDKGRYVSFYDVWDLSPFGEMFGRGYESNKDTLGKITGGKPIEFYDRIYESDSPDEYKRLYRAYGPGPNLASGGKIHIKPSKRGTFTAAAKQHGKSVQAFASQVLANKENYSPAMVKKAVFAHNSAKWHADGGPLKEEGIDYSGIATTNHRKYNPDYISYIDTAFTNAGLSDVKRASLLANIIEESGGNPFALDDTGKFYGLMQWADNRYKAGTEKDPYKEIDNQVAYILDTLGNTTDKVSWTHGGTGSGYNSYKDAMADFDAEDLATVMKGFTLGYVRPTGKMDSYNNRLKVAQQLLDRYNNVPVAKAKSLFDRLLKAYGGDIDRVARVFNDVRKP